MSQRSREARAVARLEHAGVSPARRMLRGQRAGHTLHWLVPSGVLVVTRCIAACTLYSHILRYPKSAGDIDCSPLAILPTAITTERNSRE